MGIPFASNSPDRLHDHYSIEERKAAAASQLLGKIKSGTVVAEGATVEFDIVFATPFTADTYGTSFTQGTSSLAKLTFAVTNKTAAGFTVTVGDLGGEEPAVTVNWVAFLV